MQFKDARFSFLSEDERQERANRFNASYADESAGPCFLTGVYTDCYFFDYFEEKGDTSAASLEQDITRAVCFGLKKFIHDMSTDLSTEGTLVEYGRDHHLLYFTKDGFPYQKVQQTCKVIS